MLLDAIGLGTAGSISGTVFDDLNGNGVRDPAEPAIPGYTIRLEAADGSAIWANTNGEGDYVFGPLAPGSYLVQAQVPEGYAAGSGESRQIVVGEGEKLTGIDFGLVEDLRLPETFGSADELREFLITAALERYAGRFGRPVEQWYYDGDGRVILYDDYVLFGGLGMAVEGSVFLASAADYSETNVQVAGVDEGDLVETDGQYLYVLSGSELVIIDAREASTLQVASRMEFEGRPFAEYLAGDRLTVLSYGTYQAWDQVDDRLLGLRIHTSATVITVFDVSDRQAPQLVQETEIDGWFVDSRAIGNFVYLVMRENVQLPPPELVEIENGDTAAGGSEADGATSPKAAYRYETQDEYLARIEGQILDLALPQFRSYGTDGQLIASGPVCETTGIPRPLSADGLPSMTTVVAFDVAGDDAGPVDSASVPGSISRAYASPEAFYLMKPDWLGSRQETVIYKVALDDAAGGVELAAMGRVAGGVLDQFSVDECEGYLRVATTEGWAGRWDGQGNSLNHVFVLEQNGEALKIIGRLEGLAPNEKIYSARFMGDTAFVVTYRKVDPLFAIDLSDPAEPRAVGELKIPGFSNYLHAIEDGYLIGIGRNADAETGLYQDPQVSLFDVEDLADPELLDRFTIETGRAGGLGIFDDHHVVAYYPEYQVLTVSVPDEGYWGNGSNDLWVFKIAAGMESASHARDGEIHFLGRIEHDAAVLRSVRIEDRLYSISGVAVTVHELLNPAVQLASLEYKSGDSQSVLPALPTVSVSRAVEEPVFVPPAWELASAHRGSVFAMAPAPGSIAVWQQAEPAAGRPTVAQPRSEIFVQNRQEGSSDLTDLPSGPAGTSGETAGWDDALLETASHRMLLLDEALGGFEAELLEPLPLDLEAGLADSVLEADGAH